MKQSNLERTTNAAMLIVLCLGAVFRDSLSLTIYITY